MLGFVAVVTWRLATVSTPVALPTTPITVSMVREVAIWVVAIIVAGVLIKVVIVVVVAI